MRGNSLRRNTTKRLHANFVILLTKAKVQTTPRGRTGRLRVRTTLHNRNLRVYRQPTRGIKRNRNNNNTLFLHVRRRQTTKKSNLTNVQRLTRRHNTTTRRYHLRTATTRLNLHDNRHRTRRLKNNATRTNRLLKNMKKLCPRVKRGQLRGLLDR